VGVQQIQLRTEGRENGGLGTVALKSGVLLSLQMSEARILIRLLRMYFPQNREFDSALSKLQKPLDLDGQILTLFNVSIPCNSIKYIYTRTFFNTFVVGVNDRYSSNLILVVSNVSRLKI
jgi:hypothetical protein